jgi:hypothetical protein
MGIQRCSPLAVVTRPRAAVVLRVDVPEEKEIEVFPHLTVMLRHRTTVASASTNRFASAPSA